MSGFLHRTRDGLAAFALFTAAHSLVVDREAATMENDMNAPASSPAVACDMQRSEEALANCYCGSPCCTAVWRGA